MLIDPEFTLIELPKKVPAVSLNGFSNIFGGITKKNICTVVFLLGYVVTIT